MAWTDPWPIGSAEVCAAWTLATPPERNKLARQRFAKVVIKNRTAVAVMPQPDLRAFFTVVAVNNDMKECTGGSDGIRYRGCMLPPGAMLIAEAPAGLRAGGSGRESSPRRHKLSPAVEATIQATNGASLRDLAATYGVSHETIRAVLRRSVSTLAAD